MALSKQKELTSGVKGSYWKITALTVDIQNMTAYITLCLFLGKFTSHKEPLDSIKYFSMPIEPSDLVGDLREKAYTHIKAQEDVDLAGAKSV